MDIPVEHGLLGDPGIATAGSDLSLEEVLDHARARYRRMPCCGVEDWIIFDVVVTDDELAKVRAAGCLPMIVYAHTVIHDNNRRFPPGSWVRSTIARAFNVSPTWRPHRFSLGQRWVLTIIGTALFINQ